MKNKKRLNWIFSFFSFSAIIAVILAIAYSALSNHHAKKMSAELSKAFDTVDREQALIELSTLRGRVLEIQVLYASGSSDEDLLMEHLEIITSFESAIGYDFVFETNSSEIGAVCVELLTQIDDQIDIIQSDKRGD